MGIENNVDLHMFFLKWKRNNIKFRIKTKYIWMIWRQYSNIYIIAVSYEAILKENYWNLSFRNNAERRRLYIFFRKKEKIIKFRMKTTCIWMILRHFINRYIYIVRCYVLKAFSKMFFLGSEHDSLLILDDLCGELGNYVYTYICCVCFLHFLSIFCVFSGKWTDSRCI